MTFADTSIATETQPSTSAPEMYHEQAHKIYFGFCEDLALGDWVDDDLLAESMAVLGRSTRHLIDDVEGFKSWLDLV